MLKLSKKVDYGLIALMHLAGHSEKPSWNAREIAERYDLPSELMAKILQKMVQKGFLNPLYGTNGGYTLALRADAITVAEVVEALEGPFSLTQCIPKHGFCMQFEKCTIKTPLQRLNDNVIRMLRKTTIAEMSDQWLVQQQKPMTEKTMTAEPGVPGETGSRLVLPK